MMTIADAARRYHEQYDWNVIPVRIDKKLSKQWKQFQECRQDRGEGHRLFCKPATVPNHSSMPERQWLNMPHVVTTTKAGSFRSVPTHGIRKPSHIAEPISPLRNGGVRRGAADHKAEGVDTLVPIQCPALSHPDNGPSRCVAAVLD